MLQYTLRRIPLALLTLLLITFLVYGLIRAMPGDPLQQETLDPSQQISKDDYERMKKAYGLDKPWYLAYFVWLSNMAVGDFGHSFEENESVPAVIGSRIGPTLMLSATSLLLAYLLAVPMGLYASARSNKPDERALSVTLYMLYSLPAFVAALYLQLVFSTWLNIAPLYGITSNNYNEMSFVGKVGDLLWHLILPVTAFTYSSLAYYARFVKANMEEAIRQDYIRTARAKGVGPTAVIVKHAFRNTLIPFVTLMGLTLPALLSGAIILEQIFVWPGMGKLFFDSIRRQDYPVIMGLVLMFSILTLLGQLLADLLYAIVDPRITYK